MIQNSLTDTYTLIRKLGEGSGGIVYLAYHKRLKKEVIVKQIKNKRSDLSKNRREVDILKNLQHSYLPQVLDFIEADSELFTVMSYIPGKSFQNLITEGYVFTQQQMIRWGMQLSSALNYLHTQKPPIIHSDIKPANIMLTPQGSICLIDFNISFFLDGTTMLGYTNGYSSPEQKTLAQHHSNKKIILDDKTDIYSVGATFYYLATGHKAGDNPDYDLLRQRTGESFCEVIETCMSYDKSDRYQDAFKLFHAFQSIPKRDQRYITLIKKHRFIQAGLCVTACICILLSGFGYHTMKLEITEKYNDLVAKQISYRKAQNYKEQEKTFKEAKEILPNTLESYYQNAISLYSQKDYQGCLDFINYDILENERLDLLQKKAAEVYNIKADCHFQLEQYSEAVKSYETIFKLGGYKYEYYRDYAIALAYNNETEKAEEKLQEAIRHGMQDDSIYFTKGEIHASLQNYTEAVSELRKCLSITEDDELKERAYILIGDSYKKENKLAKAREVWKEGSGKLPVQKQLIVLERLIQADIDLAQQTNDPGYQKEAITCLQSIIKNAWDSYDTYDNLVILYEKLGNYDDAAENLQIMIDKYGEDYNIFKRSAFLQIDLQEQKTNKERSYDTFMQYYTQAKTLYEQRDQKAEIDPEMDVLDTIYQKVKIGGWLS